MEYQKAKDIRGTSFGDLMAKKLLEGGGIGESLKATVSQKTKAKMTGIKESFDPLNMAKFMTGGSSLGPALLGKLMGRSKKDIKFFAGKTRKGRDSASKLGALDDDTDITSILYDIEKLLSESLEYDKMQSDKENNFAEEKESERLRRHKELIEAITGKKYSGKASATTMKKDAEEEESSGLLSMFGLKDVGKMALRGLGTLAKFALGPIGAPLLAAAAIGGFGYFIYKALKEEPSYEAEQEAKGIRQAESVGGLAGVKDEEDRIRKLPEYEKTKAEIANYEKNYNEGDKLNDAQLKGYAERGPESARAVQDYKIKRDKLLGKPATVPATATPESNSGPTATPTASAESSDTATPMPAAPASAAVMPATNENLEMNLPKDSTLAGETINTTNINTQNQPSEQSVTEIPSVRNMEETFQRMILYSTRVV
jgi:hypothetical protein